MSETIHQTKAQKAGEIFGNGYNCAQAVSSVFWPDYQMDHDLGMKLTSVMGGGYRMGDICGAAGGGAMVVALASENPGEEVKDFLNRFKELEGGIACRDILNATPEQRAQKTPEERASDTELCRKLVSNTVKILEEMGF